MVSKAKSAEPEVTEAETVKLYDAHDGLYGRDGGPYLDQIEAQEAEKRNAFIEGREPDLDNPGPYAGSLIVTEQSLVNNYNPTHFPNDTTTATTSTPVAEITAPVVAEVPVPVEPEEEVPAEDVPSDEPKQEISL